MRRLDRYIARTMWFSMILVLLVIVGIDALSAFIDESGSRSDAYGFLEIGTFVALTLPGRCYDYIPFAALVGSMIGLGQLASSSELVVMRASGVATSRLAWVVLQQSIVVALLGFMLGEYVSPAAEQRAQSGRALALYANRQLNAEQGIWRRDGRQFFHVQAYTADQRVYGVTAYDFRENGELRRVLFADRGRYQKGGWNLADVRITEFAENAIDHDSQDALLLDSNITPRVLALENVAPSQLSLDDLLGYTVFLRSQGEDVAEFELAIWKKLAQPASVAALVLIAVSFVFGPLRDGTLGFRLFVGVMVGVLFRLSQDLLGPASLVFGFPPLYAALAPVLLCVLIGAFLLRRS